MTGYSTVPYTIAYANELVADPIGFVPYAGRSRLSYLPSKAGDWVDHHPGRPSVGGILRARTRDLRDDPAKRGPERMRKLNTRRQWRCMDKLLCQVCGQPVTDGASEMIPWALTKTVFERTGLSSGRTNAPPTCWTCIPKAVEECPILHEDFRLCTVAGARSVGVLADLYRPGVFSRVTLVAHNVFVAWDDFQQHPFALATAQVVELYGMRQVG